MRKLNTKTICIATAITILIGAKITANKIREKNINDYENKTRIEMTQNNDIMTESSTKNSGIREYPSKIKLDGTPIKKNDSEEFTYFEDAKQELIELVNKDEIEQIKTKGKEYIIKGVDFIFFDKPINGIYFKDLTDEAKKASMKAIKSIDQAIMEYYPDYKNDIKEKYKEATSYIDEQYLSSISSIKKTLK